MFGAKISQGRAHAIRCTYPLRRRRRRTSSRVNSAARHSATVRIIACLYVDIYISYHFPTPRHKSSGHSLNNFFFFFLFSLFLCLSFDHPSCTCIRIPFVLPSPTSAQLTSTSRRRRRRRTLGPYIQKEYFSILYIIVLSYRHRRRCCCWCWCFGRNNTPWTSRDYKPTQSPALWYKLYTCLFRPSEVYTYKMCIKYNTRTHAQTRMHSYKHVVFRILCTRTSVIDSNDIETAVTKNK